MLLGSASNEGSPSSHGLKSEVPQACKALSLEPTRQYVTHVRSPLHLNGFVPGSLIARSSVPVLSKSHSMYAIHHLHLLYCNFVCRPRWPRVFRKPVPRPRSLITGSPSGGILGSCWPQFGPSGGSCSSFFGVHVCFFWLAACLLLVLFFSCVLSSAARLLSYQATRHRSPKR